MVGHQLGRCHSPKKSRRVLADFMHWSWSNRGLSSLACLASRFHTMPTSCCVVGCTNRHSKDVPYQFYRFLINSVHRQRWIAAVWRASINRSAWQPSTGDRVCSIHFVSEEKKDNPTHPGYIPTLYMAGEDSTAMATTAAEQSVSLIERRSAWEACKFRHFKEEAAQVASISVLRGIVSVEYSCSCTNSKSIWEPPTTLYSVEIASASHLLSWKNKDSYLGVCLLVAT